MQTLTSLQTRRLKALAQHLDPVVHVGKDGVTDQLVSAMDIALAQHQLVKVRFAACKDQKKELAPIIADRTRSAFVTRVGNVAVYYRESGDASKPQILT